MSLSGASGKMDPGPSLPSFPRLMNAFRISDDDSNLASSPGDQHSSLFNLHISCLRLSTTALPLVTPISSGLTTLHTMKLYPTISDDLAQWVQRQPVFFTGSAPTLGSHINVSPKGLADSHFAILGPNQCAYIDRTGSGCETIAHSYDNGRLCLMFMSFGPAPRIVRFFCQSKIIEWDEPAFPDLVRQIAKGKRAGFDGARAVVVANVFEVQTSCGFGVPRVKKGIYSSDESSEKPVEEILQEGVDGKVDELAVFEERPTLDAWVKKRVEDNTVQQYHNETNVTSMDGLPGLKAARRGVGERLWVGDARAWMMKVLAQREAILVGFSLGVMVYVVMMGLSVLA